jgi:hypothetical protein
MKCLCCLYIVKWKHGHAEQTCGKRVWIVSSLAHMPSKHAYKIAVAASPAAHGPRQCTHQKYAVCIWAVQAFANRVQRKHAFMYMNVHHYHCIVYISVYVSVAFMHHKRQSLCQGVLLCVLLCGCMR